MTEPNKAIISNRIYLKPINEKHLEFLVNSLTYKIEIRSKTNPKIKNIEIIKNYKILPKGIISIPQGRLDLVPPDYEIVDKRITNSVPFPLPQVELRESQKPIYNEVDDTCFINAKVGWGKTFTALHIARKLGQKTLVIVHNTFLRDQWIKEVNALYGIKPGIIGTGQFDIEDHFIVVANIQSLIKHITTIGKEFGTVILDEAHHVPAETFTTLIDSLYSRYRIGLSGTIERSDGKQVLFKDFFGDKVFKPPQSDTLNPTVKFLQTGLKLDASGTWVQKINKLLYDSDYQQFISAVAKVHCDQGHSVLVIADRVEFLEKVKEHLGENCALVTGSTTFEDRERIAEEINSGKKVCIAGSRQIFSEGISINRLSCVILAVPTANKISIEQIIGRIMRPFPGKPSPVVVDVCFSSPSEKRQQAIRTGFYMDKGWTIDKV
jgi:superfamily II DNA or RNA helicase